ncbi:MAG: SGNH/GDSL hydrolase family protein [Bacteroidota bacterium]|nr:SGNH/GDSL hydrolase family protein [Bacteroidota bacterium]
MNRSSEPPTSRKPPRLFLRYGAFLFVLSLFLTISVIAQTSTRRTTATNDSVVIVVMGSSTAKGGGVSRPDSAWVKRYERALRYWYPALRVVTLAQWAYTTYHFLPLADSIPPDRPTPDSALSVDVAVSPAIHADAIIVNLPTNDVASGFDSLEIRRNFERIAERAGEIPLWVCTPQPRNLPDSLRVRLIELKGWIEQRFSPRVIDFWSGLAAEDGSLLPQYDSGDGTHLNDAGHRILFERVYTAAIPASIIERRKRTAAGEVSP